ncbi:MAG: HTTM domain-containing protein [Bacteroidota bacterium]
MINAVFNSWQRPIPIYPLITFRIVFGVLMMFSVSRFVALGWIEDHYIAPVFHFKYYGFSWVEPLGIYGMYLVHVLLFLSALAIVVGYRYRIASVIMFLTFTYTELIDLTYYLNHYYFVSLVSFLMIFLPMNKAVSLDTKSGRTSSINHIPAWMIYSLMMMIAIVYIYAGLAKLNENWMIHALPLSIWLPAHDKLPLIGPLFKSSITHYAFSWLGMLYDTFIIFFLLLPRTRILAFVSVVLFHTMTGILFQIGVFPIVMICIVTIFFSAEWHRQFLIRLSQWLDRWHIPFLLSKEVKKYQLSRVRNKVMQNSLILFFVFQLLFPLRHFLYPGNIFWTEQGYRFSWRVMLMEKSGTATFFVKDGPNGKEGQVFNNEFLNDHQEKQMAFQPDMILQFAHFLGNHFKEKGMTKPHVRVESYVTLNGAPSRLLVDPQVNLMEVKESWIHKDWILRY